MIFDINMPVMSGAEALARFHQIDPSCPVIVMSGFVSQQDVLRGGREMVVSFLGKPVSLETVVEVARGADLSPRVSVVCLEVPTSHGPDWVQVREGLESIAT